MNLFDLIMETYPQLTADNFERNGTIELRDDSDGKGVYVSKWNYNKPLPEGIKLGK